MIHMTNTWPLPPLLRATMTTVYSCPSVCPPHSKHRDPFLTTQLYLSFPQLRPPTPYPVHRAAGYLPSQPFPCQPPVHLLPCSVSPAHHLDLSHRPLKSISAWKPSRSLHTLASRAERTASITHRLPSQTPCAEPCLSPALSSGPRTGEEVPVPAPSSLPPAPASTAWVQPFMLRPAGDSSAQTLPEQPPRSAQRYQRPSQGPSPEEQLTDSSASTVGSEL